MHPEDLDGSWSHWIPELTERRMSIRLSTLIPSPRRVTCSRSDSVHSSNAMNTCELVIPQQWKNGTFGD